MNIMVVIPARGGSKGIPRKNINLLDGKPLIHYTIEAALELFDKSQIVFSTDDPEIKKCAESAGLSVPFLRPATLATDTAGTYEVLLHAVDHYEKMANSPDVLVLLQPTSPFRTAVHIREALALYTPELDMVVAVSESKSNPYYNLFEENSAGYLAKSKNGAFTRRQDCPKIWEYNGSIYIINIDSLKHRPIGEFDKIKKYVMDDIASHDIDTPMDWNLAEIIIRKEKK